MIYMKLNSDYISVGEDWFHVCYRIPNTNAYVDPEDFGKEMKSAHGYGYLLVDEGIWVIEPRQTYCLVYYLAGAKVKIIDSTEFPTEVADWIADNS